MFPVSPTFAGHAVGAPSVPDPSYRAAQELSVAFLAEMLKTSGVLDGLGAGGEMSGAFHHTVLNEIAADLAPSTGLAEAFYRAMSSSDAST